MSSHNRRLYTPRRVKKKYVEKRSHDDKPMFINDLKFLTKQESFSNL